MLSLLTMARARILAACHSVAFLEEGHTLQQLRAAWPHSKRTCKNPSAAVAADADPEPELELEESGEGEGEGEASDSEASEEEEIPDEDEGPAGAR